MTNSPDAPPTLAVVDLECIRGDNLLFSELNFQIHAGQLVQIEGANGSGKTSLLRILAGLTRPSAGEVLWRGRDILRHRGAYNSEMVFLGHALGIKMELSAIENLKISLALSGVKAEPDRLLEALDRVGLNGREDIPTRSLSAGQKQRIALARMLVCPAQIWIVDEPFTALDVSGVALMCRLLEEHLERMGMAVITSHQAVEVNADMIKVSLS
jgi:heme exporter protein A